MNPDNNNEVASTQLDGSIITPTKPLVQVCLEYRARLDISLGVERSLRNQLAAIKSDFNAAQKMNEALANRCYNAESEVARLRELHTALKAELARLAPAPEEPVIKESLTTEPAPEWRIRAEGERIEPLEKELDYLTKEASRAADIHNHVLIVDCLRLLRDEIEQLKKNQK
jgi:hypothetical protein